MIMTGYLQDFRCAVRQLQRSPGFASVVVLTLAVGIGANSAIFSVIEAVLLRPLSYRNPEQLLILTDAQDSDIQGEDGGILYKDFSAWKSQGQAFEDFAVYYRNSGWSRVTLTNSGEPESVQGAFVSANVFPMMGIPPSLGRWFTSDEELRRERVVILSRSLWVRRLGASRDVVGKTLQINGANSQIIGVMPANFQFPAKDAQFWAPITTNPNWGDPGLTTIDPQHGRGFYARWKAVGRLRSGISLAQAQTEISAISERLEVVDHDPHRAEVKALPLQASVSGNTKLVLSVLSGTVFLVLLIACINVSNLFLARGAAREREMAIRTALGAGRPRLVRQLFMESGLLAVTSGCFGAGLASLGVRLLTSFAPKDIPRLERSGIDIRVLAFTLAVSLFAAILFGLIPAWKVSRTAPGESLKLGTQEISSSIGLKRTHGILVVTEFALAVMLLIGAGLLVHSFLALEAVDPGFEPEHVFMMKTTAPPGRPEPQTRSLYQSALDRVKALPGVQAAGGINSLFDIGPPFLLGLRATEGRAPEAKEKWTPLIWDTVSGDYFAAMGIPWLRGRHFSDQDTPNSALVAIIDEDMARRYWPGEDPVGQRIKGQDRRGGNDDWVTVIGVVGNVRNHGLDKQSTPHVYEWYQQSGELTPDLIVRTTAAGDAFAATLRAAVRGVDQTAILSPVNTLDQQLADQLSPRRFQAWLLSSFSLIALLLACVGIYGMISYSVVQRNQEIGVRMALGARPRDVMNLVMGDGAKFAMAGLAIGTIAATGLTKFMTSLLFGVTATDPVTFAAVAILLVAVALLASYFPVRRAAKVDPMVALRYE
jgi:predicted permease